MNFRDPKRAPAPQFQHYWSSQQCLRRIEAVQGRDSASKEGVQPHESSASIFVSANTRFPHTRCNKDRPLSHLGLRATQRSYQLQAPSCACSYSTGSLGAVTMAFKDSTTLERSLSMFSVKTSDVACCISMLYGSAFMGACSLPLSSTSLDSPGSLWISRIKESHIQLASLGGELIPLLWLLFRQLKGRKDTG